MNRTCGKARAQTMATRRPELPKGISITFYHEDWHFEARWKNQVVVGRAMGLAEGMSLKIADLEVDAECALPWPIAHSLLVWFGAPCRRKSFRGLGIGTALLRHILSEASHAGFTRVWGSITPSDLKKTPHLIDWYRSRGFEVSHESSDTVVRAVATVSCSVSPAEAAASSREPGRTVSAGRVHDAAPSPRHKTLPNWPPPKPDMQHFLI